MDFEPVASAAERMGVTVRAVQKWAAAGKIPGAVKMGGTWMIPVNAENVSKPRFEIPMPVMNLEFTLGKCEEFINGFSDKDLKNIAYAEYYYFKGNNEEAAKIAEKYLSSNRPSLRFSAAFVCAFANLSLGHVHLAHYAMEQVLEMVEEMEEDGVSKEIEAIGILTQTAIGVILHIPEKSGLPLEDYVKYIPGGLKMFALYVLSHRAYLKKDFSRAIGIAETALVCSHKIFPVGFIYCHIMAAVCNSKIGEMERAKEHLRKAWGYAEKDGIVGPFAEHFEMKSELMEEVIRSESPLAYAEILVASGRFFAGWKKTHGKVADKNISDKLTQTEITVAMLYHRNWLIKDIAEHMQTSERTVMNHIQIIFAKLGVSTKEEFENYMKQ